MAARRRRRYRIPRDRRGRVAASRALDRSARRRNRDRAGVRRRSRGPSLPRREPVPALDGGGPRVDDGRGSPLARRRRATVHLSQSCGRRAARPGGSAAPRRRRDRRVRGLLARRRRRRHRDLGRRRRAGLRRALPRARRALPRQGVDPHLGQHHGSVLRRRRAGARAQPRLLRRHAGAPLRRCARARSSRRSPRSNIPGSIAS